jgi:hypothetical protein
MSEKAMLADNKPDKGAIKKNNPDLKRCRLWTGLESRENLWNRNKEAQPVTEAQATAAAFDCPIKIVRWLRASIVKVGFRINRFGIGSKLIKA